MSISIPQSSKLGSPSFIEQQWKSIGKENSEALSKEREPAKTPLLAQHKTPENNKRVPSFIATLSPKKPKFSAPQKKVCPSSPIKPSLTPQAAAWNTFIPLHYCQQPFELPHNQIQAMIASIKSARKLPPLLAQGAMLAKIAELAHTFIPNLLVHYKKQSPLVHPANASPPNKGLAGSFFAASFTDRIYVMVSNRQVLAKGSLGKVTEATGLLFKRNGSKIEFEGLFDAVKHTVALKESEHDTLDSVLKRVKTRVQAATDLSGVPHVANPFFHGVLQGQKGRKMVMVYPRYGGDLLAYHVQHLLTDEQRQCNTLKIAEQLGTALKGIHDRNYIHRDVKEENLLVNWTSDQLLETVVLADFDLSTNAIDNTPCGTLQYISPEMMATAFKSEEIAQALGVQDLSTLFGASLDTWGLGLILHHSLYNRMPEHVNLLMEFLAWNNEIQEAEHTPPEHQQSLRRYADEAKEKWIQSMLEAIEKEKVQQPPEDITWDNFIQSLLAIDPRKRPDDAAIQKAIVSLKASMNPGPLQN
ncbi:MAG: protein kinase [Parachlamydia sp.]|nr:protein kinase [Parachlamydia sp.]